MSFHCESGTAVSPYGSLSLGEIKKRDDQNELFPNKSSTLLACLSTAVILFSPQVSQIYQSITANTVAKASFKNSRLDLERADIITIARIRNFGDYLDGWDGDGGKSPSKAAISEAEKFARLLSFDKVYTPHISLASDGEINLLWILHDFRLDLGFYGDGTYSYYGRTADGEEFMADDQPFDKVLPDQIIQLIRKKSY